VEKMNALAANYAALLSETRPEVIQDEKQNQAYIRRLEELTSKKSVTRAEEKLTELLAVLIEDFEAKHFPVPEAPPVAIIRHLMGPTVCDRRTSQTSSAPRASPQRYCTVNGNSPGNISGG